MTAKAFLEMIECHFNASTIRIWKALELCEEFTDEELESGDYFVMHKDAIDGG